MTTDLSWSSKLRPVAADGQLGIRGTWSKRTDHYSEERSTMTESLRDKVEMYRIGG